MNGIGLSIVAILFSGLFLGGVAWAVSSSSQSSGLSQHGSMSLNNNNFRLPNETDHI